MNDLSLFILIISLSILVGIIFYTYVEKPTLKKLRENLL